MPSRSFNQDRHGSRDPRAGQRSRVAGALLLALTVWTLSGCGGTEFAGGTGGKRSPGADAEGQDPNGTDQANGTGQTLGNNQGGGIPGLPGQTGGPAAISDLVDSSGTIVPCPKEAQNLLILDFKSGWWAGDGGDFFQRVLGGLSAACIGAVTIEYHHILGGFDMLMGGQGSVINTSLLVPGGRPAATGGTFETAFNDPSWDSYSQVWILSGSQADSADISVASPFFQQVLQRAGAKARGIFVGAGYGSVTHANAASAALGLGATFTPTQAEGRLLNPMGGTSVISNLNTSQQSAHPLFSRGAANPADIMDVDRDQARGDNLQVSGAMTMLARDGAGNGAIAAGIRNGRNVVLDAGLQRYYSIWNNQSPATAELIRNIIVYLSR